MNTPDTTAHVQFEEHDQSLLKKIQYFLHGNPTITPAIVLLFSLVFFSMIVGQRFIHVFNLSLILQQVTIIGFVAIAQTLIILTAGIDLSVGAIMVLSSVVMGKLAVSLGIPTPVAFAAGILVGILAGAFNGVLVARIKLPPFIVTLGSWNVFLALNLWYSESETIRSQDVSLHAPFLQWLGTSFSFLEARLTYGSLLLILLFLLFWYILNHTAWGRHIYAYGDDAISARLAGISTLRVALSVYIVAGVICSLAGWALIGRIGSVSPQAGYTTNLDSITAVVIGGTSLFGGRGSILGTLFGAIIVGVFRNGLALAGIDVLWQEFAVGILIICAVMLDQWIRKV